MDHFDDSMDVRVVRYLKKDMTAIEIRQFEQEIYSNPVLRDELNAQAELLFMLRNRDILRVHKQVAESLQGIELQPDFENLPPEFNPGLAFWKRIPKYLFIIGGVLIITFALLWRNHSVRTSSEETFGNLANPYMVPFEDVIAFPSEENSFLSLGMQAYDRGQYPQAILSLENHLKSNPADNHVRMYLGISHLLNKQPKEAIAILSELANVQGYIGTTSKWYLALATLKLDDTQTTILLLKQLSTDTIFGKDAKDLLEAVQSKSNTK